MKRYEKYKDSGVKWLGEVPDKWKVVRFKNIFKEINDRSLNGVEDLLSVSQFTGVTKKSDKLDEGDLLTSANSLEGYKLVRKGDLVSNIMLAWNGSLAFSGYDGITSPAYSVYRVKTKDDNRFLHYLVRSEIYKAEFKRNSSGVIESRLRLYTDDFFAIYGLVPPLSEQQAIAEFLDEKTTKIDQAISIKEKEIDLLKERRQILIQELVTGKKIWDGNQWTKPTKTKDSGVDWIGEIPEDWEVKKLKSFCEAYGRIGFRGYTTSDLVDVGEGAITISPSNIKENDMEFEKNSFLSWEKYNESPEIKIRENDILIVKTGSTYGKIGIVKNLPQKATINPQLLVLKKIKLNVDFLYESLKSDCFKTQIEKKVIGSTIPTISESKILGFVIPVPIDKKYLTGIVNRLMNINEKYFKIISIKQQEIEKLKEYKTVLIDNVVTGKIKVC